MDVNECLDAAYKAALVDPMCGKSCPKCRSERYYWLKSSGRCFECGFHWGVNKVSTDSHTANKGKR